MSCRVEPVFKYLSTVTWEILSLPPNFSSKTSYPYLSSPSKPINIHLSFSPISLFSVNTRTHASTTVAAAWAEQGPINSFVEDEVVRVDAVGDACESGGDEGFEEKEELYPEPLEGTKLFVWNLEYDVDKEILAQLFEQAGVVEVAEVVYNKETTKSRRFGFVTMSTVEEADKAIKMFHHYDLNGNLLVVNKARRSLHQSHPSGRIYVGNLAWDVDNELLGQLFSKYGSVVDARVIYDLDTRQSRRFGFVTMSTEDETKDAVFNLNTKSFRGRTINVKLAVKSERPSFFSLKQN